MTTLFFIIFHEFVFLLNPIQLDFVLNKNFPCSCARIFFTVFCHVLLFLELSEFLFSLMVKNHDQERDKKGPEGLVPTISRRSEQGMPTRIFFSSIVLFRSLVNV